MQIFLGPLLNQEPTCTNITMHVARSTCANVNSISRSHSRSKQEFVVNQHSTRGTACTKEVTLLIYLGLPRPATYTGTRQQRTLRHLPWWWDCRSKYHPSSYPTLLSSPQGGHWTGSPSQAGSVGGPVTKKKKRVQPVTKMSVFRQYQDVDVFRCVQHSYNI